MTAVFLPLMTDDQPDTAERVRWAVQAIPFALPETDWSLLSGAAPEDSHIVTVRDFPPWP